MLYPQKNLIPPFDNSGWFQDTSAAGGTMLVNGVNPHKMTLTITASAQGRLIHIPVQIGKAYTFSFKHCGGLYRIYKQKVVNHDATKVIVNHSDTGMPQTATFTADDSYLGFITIRLTHSVAGTYTFENMQLEEGLASTVFEPYKLGNKPVLMPKETINTDLSGASSHVYPYGNVIEVKEDVRLWGYKIQVGTPLGTFDSVIYEWNNGAFGVPIFREVINATASGIMNLSYKGVLLKAGKKYYIGRNDPNRDNSSVGNAGVYRKTGVNVADYKYIKTLGGTQFYSPAIDFPSTWYYIFALEIESQKHKPATLVPKKNIFPKENLVHGSWQGSPLAINTGSALYKALKDPIKLKAGTYTVSSRGDVNVAALNAAGTVLFGTNDTLPRSFTITMDSLIYFHFRKKDSSAWDSSTFPIDTEVLGLQLEAGSSVTPFESIKLVNKPAVLIPKKNLIPPLTDPLWFVKFGQIKGTIVNDYEYRMVASVVSVVGFDIPIKLKPNTTYTLGGTFIGAGARLRLMRADNDAFIINLNPSAPIQTYTTGTYIDLKIRIENNGQAGDFTTKDFFLYEGNISNPVFEPMQLINKPAKLYPQKNLLKGTIPANVAVTEFDSYYFRIKTDAAFSVPAWDSIEVQPYTDYTLSFDKEAVLNDVGISIEQPSGTLIANKSGALPYTFNTGANNVIKIRFWRVNALGADIKVSNWQLEKGSKTPFAPYELGNKPL